MNDIYKLTSVNLTNLGGPMGTEYTYNNYVKYFDSKEKAKDYAEKDHGRKIHWFNENGKISSDDLMSVIYHISKIEVE